MYEYKVLIVDDEFHVIEMVSRLLEQIKDISIDTYSARNTTEAINLLELGRMDMVITDIEMPGRNGLELVSYIRSRWKLCRVVILTAFSQFQYAYSALQLRADGYILKTESDDEIRSKLHDVLCSIEANMLESAYYAEKKMQHVHAVPKNELLALLTSSSDLSFQTAKLTELGFNSSSPNLFLLMCRNARNEVCNINETVLHELLGHYFRDSVCNMELAHPDDSSFIWLIEFIANSDYADANRISGLLEMVQNACLNAFKHSLSFVFGICNCDHTPLSEVYGSIKTAFSLLSDSDHPFIYRLGDAMTNTPVLPDIPGATLNWLCKHIDDNLSSDLSLVTLAALTGYNPQYLSTLFQRRMGMTLSRYISDKRMAIARKMLADIKIPIQDIASHLGFTSHSYFSRFIRKETGLTPQQLRIQLLCITKH